MNRSLGEAFGSTERTVGAVASGDTDVAIGRYPQRDIALLLFIVV